MSVRIKLEDGREVLVGDRIDAVRQALEFALRNGQTIQIDTPDGPVYLNPSQIVSVEPLSPAQQRAAAEAVAGTELAGA